MGERKKENPKHTQRRMSAAQKRKFIALAGWLFYVLFLSLAFFILLSTVMYTEWIGSRSSRMYLFRE